MNSGVIEFDNVSTTYPGAVAPIIRDLAMRVEGGEICAVVGPSGSGKTTMMRMVNRLQEPTAGAVRIDGTDNRMVPLETLRRSIGYVIQQVGLFPHRTIADNVATVPRLLGWSEVEVVRRVGEMLELVGLQPATFAGRYPSQLSGGQRQRVGVARALAADPPVLLMDEPFGAIDPVVRGEIQDEFLRMQTVVRKTIVIVTHDIDEALKLGDRVAVFQEGGVLAQIATPDELLARPANDFVARFVGGDTALRRLGLVTVAQAGMLAFDEAARRGHAIYVDAEGRPAHWADGRAATPGIPGAASVREALSLMLASGCYVAPVVDAAGRAIGVVTADMVDAVLRAPAAAAGRPDAVHPAALRPPNAAGNAVAHPVAV